MGRCVNKSRRTKPGESLSGGSNDQCEIDAGRIPATTIRQLVSALRQDFAGMGAALSTLEILLDKDDLSPFDIEQMVDRLAVHLRRADAKATLAMNEVAE